MKMEYNVVNTRAGVGIFVTERRSWSTFSEGRKPERRSGTFFFSAIGIKRLGVSCYPSALLSNKLA
jgi:hypothetical protein